MAITRAITIIISILAKTELPLVNPYGINTNIMVGTKEPITGQPKPKRKVPKRLQGPEAGRPPKVTKDVKRQILEAFKHFIKTTEDPNIPEFCTSVDICLDYEILPTNIWNWQEFKSLRKAATAKQEAYLLKTAGIGKYNATLAIFRLKQPLHGYKDRVDSDITTGGERLGVGLSAEQADQLIRARANRSNI